MIKQCAIFFLFSVTLFIHSPTRAEPHRVNILGWEGYLEIEQIELDIREIEKKCDVEIVYDTYANYNLMFYAFERYRNEYDILIAPDTYLLYLKNLLPESQVDLTDIANSYAPGIKLHYFKENYPKNILFFAHSITGFLVKKNIIEDEKSFNISALIKKLKEGYNFSFLDDPIEMNLLFNQLGKKDVVTFLEDSQLSENYGEITIANIQTTDFIEQENFGASYLWLGEAVTRLDRIDPERKIYEFLTFKDLSHISTDLLIQIHFNDYVTCAMRELGSEKFLNKLTEATEYISPFLNPESSKKSDYPKDLTNSVWLHSYTKEEILKLDREWQEIKFNLTKTYESE